MWSTLLFTLVGTSAVLSQTALDRSKLPKTIRNPPRNERYFSGQVHNELMARKNAKYDAVLRKNTARTPQYKSLAYTPCVDGRAGEFRCSNIDLYSFKSHADLGSDIGGGSSSWGWTHNGTEYAIIAQSDGAAFTRINAETGELVYIGRLPQTPNIEVRIWRELRVAGDILVIGSESIGHHVQIFDLKKLLAITPEEQPKIFDPTTDLTGFFDKLPVGRTHNIVLNAELQYGVSVGSQPRNSTFASGLVFFDLKDPSNPELLGYQAEDGYVHDAQCLVYRGPDTRFEGKDICYGYNEDTLTIYDVTNKANATIISRTTYEGASYTHQGWVLDTNDQRYLILDDELDEIRAVGPAADGFPVTFIWDIQDLTAPTLTGGYKTAVKGIDHNQYVSKGRAYQSNYGAGLRILDVSSIPYDPTGAGVKEIGFFDIYPEDDEEEGGGIVEFVGTWSSYGLFESGWILINTIERGAYTVRYTGK